MPIFYRTKFIYLESHVRIKYECQLYSVKFQEKQLLLFTIISNTGTPFDS